ncbi:MAG: 5-carboxymethyl-2-hydroxymuconate Delta-isomerase [Alphaproteobacteria bacterium]|nr:5-carboxymethyl-2-hydroxymuconate Delta-isomerase [Alphaproteobacteria bacterium]
MPHFIIDYSRDLEPDYDISKVMQIAFDSGVASGVMQAVDIKVRARPYDHYRILNAGDSFVHVTVFLLAGRSDAQKERVSLALRQNLVAYLANVTSVSIDIRDMNPHAYKKRVLPVDDDA